VEGVPGDEDAPAIFSAMIGIANTMGMDILAE
jgi:hypothetical protein